MPKYRGEWGGVYDSKEAAKNDGGFIGGLMSGGESEEAKAERKAREAARESAIESRVNKKLGIEYNEKGIASMEEGNWRMAQYYWKSAYNDYDNEEAGRYLEKYAAEINAQLADDKAQFPIHKKGAESGDIEAMYKLAYAYEYSIGTWHSRSKARAWYTKAAAKGHEGAKKWLAENKDRGNIFLSIVFAVIGAIALRGLFLLISLNKLTFLAIIAGLVLGFIAWRFKKLILKIAIVGVFVFSIIIGQIAIPAVNNANTKNLISSYIIGNSVITNIDNAELYDTPGDDNYNVLALIPKGVSLTIIDKPILYDKKRGWYDIPVEYNGIKGYIDSADVVLP